MKKGPLVHKFIIPGSLRADGLFSDPLEARDALKKILGRIEQMKSVRKIYAARLLALVCDADAQNYSRLARAARRLPKFIIHRLAAVAGD